MSNLGKDSFFGWESSAEAWLRIVESDPNRTDLLDPIMLDLCGTLDGAAVLDVGCGNARFCRLLEERGASCTGLDVIRTFLKSVPRHSRTQLALGDGANLPFVAGSFDVVIAYLSLIDIEDFRQAIFEGSRVLVSGGRFIVANIHPMASSIPGWVKDDAGNRLFLESGSIFRGKSGNCRMVGHSSSQLAPISRTIFRSILECWVDFDAIC